jgi:hypothetical protein
MNLQQVCDNTIMAWAKRIADKVQLDIKCIILVKKPGYAAIMVEMAYHVSCIFANTRQAR